MKREAFSNAFLTFQEIKETLPNRKILTVRSHNWAQVNATPLYSTGAW